MAEVIGKFIGLAIGCTIVSAIWLIMFAGLAVLWLCCLPLIAVFKIR